MKVSCRLKKVQSVPGLLSGIVHVKQCKAVYSIKTKTKANLSRKHWLTKGHRWNHRCKRRLMHEIDALQLNLNHAAEYAHIVIDCDGPKIRMCTKSDNKAMATDLMVI